ncbi:MAG: HEAT repeat domain-containing protein [Deltaproteobacteria bacterium]|nr:HEAT repeat domain-containing protein [Deltaproteobacteria bacterium]
MRGLLVALLLGQVLPACKGKAENAAPVALGVSSLRVKERGPAAHRLARFGEKQVEAFVRGRVESTPALAFLGKGPEGERKGYTLSVEYGLGPREGKEELAALVVVRLDPGIGEGMPLESSLIAPLKDVGGDKKHHMERTLAAALMEVFWQAKMVRCPPGALVKALQAEKDMDRLLKLIPIAAERKIKDAVPQLIRLLSHEKRPVSDRAIGALATLRDPRGVKPLTKLAKLRDSRRLAQVIDAVAAIGGAEAASFLDFLAGGHANATIRNLAREARARMTRAKTKSP